MCIAKKPCSVAKQKLTIIFSNTSLSTSLSLIDMKENAK